MPAALHFKSPLQPPLARPISKLYSNLHPSTTSRRLLQTLSPRLQQPTVTTPLTALHQPVARRPTVTISSLFARLFGSSRPAANMAEVKNTVKSYIEKDPVVVFSKSWCPYCRTAKATLSAQGAKFQVYELDQIDQGSEIQSAIGELTGQSTVPAIYIGGEFIGGNSDLQAIKSELPDRLKKANAL